MKFGHFDDKNKEYVIDTPYTPLPWINYLAGDDFFSIISNTAGGYSFYRDAKLRRITRYLYNSPATDNGGRYFYIADENTVFLRRFCRAKLRSTRINAVTGLIIPFSKAVKTA